MQKIPPVDPEDFKKCWQLRRELEGGSIDLELFRQICKPETDAFAAGFRASTLLAMLPLIPPEELVNGEPSDPLLTEFARMPFEEGKVRFKSAEIEVPKIKSLGSRAVDD
jgi:hypothetical protein